MCMSTDARLMYSYPQFSLLSELDPDILAYEGSGTSINVRAHHDHTKRQ